MYFLFNRTIIQVFVTYFIGPLYVHPLWFYKHQDDNRVLSKLFVVKTPTIVSNNPVRTCEITSRIAMAKPAFDEMQILPTSQLNLNLRKKILICYILSRALCGAETLTLGKVEQKYLECFEMKWDWLTKLCLRI